MFRQVRTANGSDRVSLTGSLPILVLTCKKDYVIFSFVERPDAREGDFAMFD